MFDKKEIKTTDCPAAIGPYSQGIIYGKQVMTSGQLPISSSGEMSNDVMEQTRQSLNNVKAVLIAAGSDMTKVIKCTVFLSDMNDFQKVNQVYGEFFNEPFPARCCVQVARLPKDAKVEIEAIAYTE
ncbi:MAG: RidA family protein [Dehalobacterium sp.]